MVEPRQCSRDKIYKNYEHVNVAGEANRVTSGKILDNVDQSRES